MDRPGRRDGASHRPPADEAGVAEEQDFLLGAALQRGVPARYGARPPGPDGEPVPERPRVSRSRRAEDRDAGASGRHGAVANGSHDRGGNGYGPHGHAPNGSGANGHNGYGYDGNGHGAGDDGRAADETSRRRPSERIRDSYAFDGTGPDTGPRRRPPREERPPPRSRTTGNGRAPGDDVDRPRRDDALRSRHAPGPDDVAPPPARRPRLDEPPRIDDPPRFDGGVPPPAATGSHRARGPVAPDDRIRPDRARPDVEQNGASRTGRRRAQEPVAPPYPDQITGWNQDGVPDGPARNGSDRNGRGGPDGIGAGRNGRGPVGHEPGRPDGRQRHDQDAYGERSYADEPTSRRRAPSSRPGPGEPVPPRTSEWPPPGRRAADPSAPAPAYADEPGARRRAPEPSGPRAYAGDEPVRRPRDPLGPPMPPADAPDPRRTRRDPEDLRGADPRGADPRGAVPHAEPGRYGRPDPGAAGERPVRPRGDAADPSRRPVAPGDDRPVPTEAIAAAAAPADLDDAGTRDAEIGDDAAQDTTALPGRRRRAAGTRGRGRSAVPPAATDVDGTARARDPVRGDPDDGDRPGAAALADPPDDDPDATVAADTDGPREGKRSGPAGVAGKIAALTSKGGRSKGDDGEKKPMSFWKELPLLVGVALVLTFLISTFVAKVFVIPSGSMETTLHGCTGCTNDRVLVDKVTYNFTDISPGDVVVFRGPDSWSNSEYELDQPSSALTRGLQMAGSLIGLSPPDEKDFVKRVIAVGGQTVACCDALNQVMVDGQPLDEPYIYYLPEAGPARQIPFGPITVPQGEMWMMGDSRNNSADSRASGHGPVPEENVIGKVRLIVLPFDRFGWVDAVDPQTTQTAAGPESSGGLPAGAPLALGMMGAFPFALGRRRALRRRAEEERFLPLTRRRSRWRATS
ncbi:signal peptidase I [Pseudonocardia sediminis]|uniref:Signal peptidase I n=1 Tax=Pseudonocardia sediminis TaxID=1397368 RepID=A0A4Q7UUK6_PSEST|nr:signal peptidase I [Pseudonocardia sediminis]